MKKREISFIQPQLSQLRVGVATGTPACLGTDSLGEQHERCLKIHFFFLETLESKAGVD